VILLWLGGAAAVLFYPWATPPQIPVAVAYLLEGSLFLTLGFPAVLSRLREAISDHWLAALLCVSAVVPYCLYSVAGAVFRWDSFWTLVVLAVLAAFWFRLIPRNPLMDLSFLALVAVVSLVRMFPELYLPTGQGLKPDFLGQMMWRRIAVISVVWFRPQAGVELGFVPSGREWLIGLQEYLFFVPIGGAIALATGLFRFRSLDGDPWRTVLIAAGTFLGMLWFVALTEEFFFRGMLQQWLCAWTGNRRIGLAMASLAFGAVHLLFRYPPLNWRFALVAAAAGFFYGRAFERGGLRCAMVSHALVNVTWRTLFV